MVKPRIKIPEQASKGELVTIKTLLRHRMESGHREDESGALVPRKIINKFICEFNGSTVFECSLHTAIAANPYFKFQAKIEEAGVFLFRWIDDDGSEIEEKREITIV